MKELKTGQCRSVFRTTFNLSLSIKHKDLTRKLCVFIFYFIGSVVKILCFYFLYIKGDRLQKN